MVQADEACAQLGAALKKCDGQPSPPDFVTGEAAREVKSMIEERRAAAPFWLQLFRLIAGIPMPLTLSPTA